MGPGAAAVPLLTNPPLIRGLGAAWEREQKTKPRIVNVARSQPNRTGPVRVQTPLTPWTTLAEHAPHRPE